MLFAEVYGEEWWRYFEKGQENETSNRRREYPLFNPHTQTHVTYEFVKAGRRKEEEESIEEETMGKKDRKILEKSKSKLWNDMKPCVEKGESVLEVYKSCTRTCV